MYLRLWLKDTLEIIKNKFPQIQTQTIFYIFLILSLIDIYRIDRIINPRQDSGQQNQIATIESFESVFNEDETIIFLKENLGLNKFTLQDLCLLIQNSNIMVLNQLEDIIQQNLVIILNC